MVVDGAVQIVVCVEFDPALRMLDVGDDLAFLVSDFAARGGERPYTRSYAPIATPAEILRTGWSPFMRPIARWSRPVTQIVGDVLARLDRRVLDARTDAGHRWWRVSVRRR